MKEELYLGNYHYDFEPTYLKSFQCFVFSGHKLHRVTLKVNHMRSV